MPLPLVSLVFLVSTVTAFIDLNTNGCGIQPGPYPTTISNGSAATPDKYPWNIALYRKDGDSEEPQYICVGTIIHPRVVLTAAACVYNESSGEVKNSTFIVAAGKYNWSWEHRDPQEQRRLVNKIYIPQTYLGFRGWYANDIALLALNESFVLGTAVLPVCIDWKSEIEDALLQSMNGTVVGWVRNKNGTVTSELHVETSKYYSLEECRRRLRSKNLARLPIYLTPDKFCAVSDNFAMVAVGGGLTYSRNTTANKHQHYLFGVADVKLSTTGLPDIVTYNDVKKHLAWLNETLFNISN